MCSLWAPTAVAPPIPLEDMTPLERLLLSLVLDAKEDGRALVLRTRHGPSDIITLSRADLMAALEESAYATGSVANAYVAERLEQSPAGDDSEPFDDFDLDMTGTSCEAILQDIVRRSSTIGEIVVKSASLSDGPLFEEFSGKVTLITPASIRSKSTYDMLEDLREDRRIMSARAVDAA